MTALEKRAGYEWIEFMRKKFFPPFRDEFRCKARTRITYLFIQLMGYMHGYTTGYLIVCFCR